MRYNTLFLAFGLFATASLCATNTTSESNAPAVETTLPENMVENIPPIIVQASRTGRSANEIPAHVQVLSGDEIVRHGHQNILEVLQKQAGIPIKNFADSPATATIAMRGYGESAHGRVVVLLNGERLNNPDMSAPNLLRIPLTAVKRIEIIRGPHGVLYGDFASAGVVNIITDTSITLEPLTTATATIGSYDHYNLSLTSTGVFSDGVTYFAGLNWDKSGGYRYNSDYTSWNIDTSIAKAWENGTLLSLSSFCHDNEYGLPGALTHELYKHKPRSSNNPDDRAWFKTWGINLGGSTPVFDNGVLEANLTYSQRDAESRFKGSGYRIDNDNVIDSYGLTPRYTHESDIYGKLNRLTAGIDLRHERSDISSHSIYSGFPSSTTWDLNRTSTAGYLQNEFFFQDNLSLLLGARGERINHRIHSQKRNYGYSHHKAAWEAALLYRPMEETKFFLRGARHYHAPFIDEIVGWSGVPNTRLTPERSYTVEGGGEIKLHEELTLSLTLYHSLVSRELYYDPTRFENINSPADISRSGAETGIRWEREKVGALGVYYDYVYAMFTEGNYKHNQVPLVPQHLVTFNGEIALIDDLALLSNLNIISAQHSGSDFDNKARKLSAYGTLDLALRYEPYFVKGLRLLAGVDNVLDRDYAYCSFYGSSYYPAAGRTWKVTVSYAF